jgi:hypothetical protein
MIERDYLEIGLEGSCSDLSLPAKVSAHVSANMMGPWVALILAS